MDDLKLNFNIINPTEHKPVILAVDDNEDNLMLIALALDQLFNCSLVTAVDGQTALSSAHIHQPDLILLDIVLPDINGKEVARRLRGHPDTKAIPTIAVTAQASLEDRVSILAAGCDDYLSKPYMLADLEAIIHRHLSIPSLIGVWE